MTTAAIVPLKKHGYDDLVTKLSACKYDPRDVPMEDKEGITAGMSMTEKQGGSDVRANTTTAEPEDKQLTGNSHAYRLVGHKWFTSAPMCDIFLTLANTEGSKTPSCFVVPRWIPKSVGGGRNSGFQVMRLKDKLGDRANASSEVEYNGAYGTMLGDEGRGVKTIIDMVQSTRLDCIIGSAGG
jgi:putative acyl-CoA dehydrogenase